MNMIRIFSAVFGLLGHAVVRSEVCHESPQRQRDVGSLLLQHAVSGQRAQTREGGDFTIVFIPDTQNMVEDQNRNGWRLSDWISQVDWVVQQKSALNIMAVIHVGDLVQIADRAHEWDNFNKGWDKIVQSGIAWSLVPGNHDLNTMACWDCADRWDIYNQKMTPSWQRNANLEESYPPGRFENSVVLFEASGIEFMIVAVELGPGVTPSSQGTLDWASQKLRQYPQRRAIINNHFVLWGTERREVISIAEWAKQHRNVFLIQQGHDCAREWNKVIYNDWGEPIMEVLTDYQCSGDAYLRYYSFNLGAKEIQAYTYSPVRQQYERDSNSEFAFPFELETPSGAAVPQNIYRKVSGVGSWGGWCTCPDGKRYNVGDRNDACESGPESLACVGGEPGECVEVHDDSRDGMQVTCMTSNTSSTTFDPTTSEPLPATTSTSSSLRTSPGSTTAPITELSFSPVDGGEGRACRGPGGLNEASFYSLKTAGSIDVCKVYCAGVPECTGIEWNPNGRCEVWTTAIGSSVPVDGFTCMQATPSASQSPASTSTTLVMTSAAPQTTDAAGACYGELDSVAADEGTGIGDKIETMSPEDCQRSCNDIDQCKSFAHCPHFEGCWLKDKVFLGSEATRDFYDCKTYFKRPCDSSDRPTPVPTPSPSPSTGSSELVRVMSYNTVYTGYPDSVPEFGQKIREVAPAVMGAQEVGGEGSYQLGDAAGYQVVPESAYGNPILYDPSKVSLVADSDGRMNIPRDDYAQRVLTWAKFRIGDSTDEFWFFNTHLPHNHNEAAPRETHARIARMLLEKREELGPASVPTVVVCDCNPFASDGSSEGSFESNLASAGIKRSYMGTGEKGGYPGLDKIFVSGQFLSSNGADHGAGASDHPAISVDLRLSS